MKRVKDNEDAALRTTAQAPGLQEEEFSPEYAESLVEGDIRPIVIKNYNQNGDI